MEESTSGTPCPQLYVLSHDDYAELCNIRTLLIQMAQEAYDEDHPGNANQRLPVTRCEIYFVLMAIGAQIQNALNGVRHGNYIAPLDGLRH